jgi:uncharacterized glyoxalase superfamily protein PhnB
MAFVSPEGWTRISSSLSYDEPRKAIDFLCKAFGFKVHLLVGGENDSVVHSELVIDGGIIMVGTSGGTDGKAREWRKSPRSLGGANTQNIMVYVDDVEAHFAHAKSVGAKIVSEPKMSDYGEGYWVDRSYECEDIEGHHWYFVQRLADLRKGAPRDARGSYGSSGET